MTTPFVANDTVVVPVVAVPVVKPAPAAPAKSWWDVAQPFVIGGLSGCLATCFIQPVDMVKVQIQLKSEEISVAKKAGKPVNIDLSPMTTIKEIMSTGGIRAFYKG